MLDKLKQALDKLMAKSKCCGGKGKSCCMGDDHKHEGCCGGTKEDCCMACQHSCCKDNKEGCTCKDGKCQKCGEMCSDCKETK